VPFNPGSGYTQTAQQVYATVRESPEARSCFGAFE
jgi:hypothetical protein